MTSLHLWLGLQVLLEAVLIALMVVFLFKLRRIDQRRAPGMPDEIQTAMTRFLSESEKLSSKFTETLQEKKEISVNLMLKLERKITEMNQLLERAEQGLSDAQRARLTDHGHVSKANPAAPENRALVLRLANQGMSIEEIARQAQLNKGEVELILDLEKQFGL